MDDFTQYIASLDGPARDAVEHVRARALELVPDAEEGTSYGMAALRYRGSPLISARATANHIGLYPFSPPAIEALAPDLAGFSTSKGTVRFTPDRPLPDDVLDRLVLFRRDEIDAMRSR
ncbi:iron chaperone [Promicromonospora sp. NPDC050880]|uniref:iron chaperone n=1 Tax=Promicromonospora sp. NPDC050880 TaxID=3364406 RepID=UPI00379ECA10